MEQKKSKDYLQKNKTILVSSFLSFIFWKLAQF